MADPLFWASVCEACHTAGLGPLVLEGAVSGYTAIGAHAVTGDTFYYSALNVDNPTQIEIGLGTFRSDGKIDRASLNGQLIDFTDGLKKVCVIKLAPRPVILLGGALGGSSGGLSDAELRATPVAVSGPLTDVQLRAAALPVSGPLTDAQLRATPLPISGSVSITGNVNVPNGLDVDVLSLPALPSGANAIGSVSVSNFPASQTITGTISVGNFPATQAVSGPLTDTQLRASAVPISGALTDTQLRASAVPVSGPLTDTQLRASAVPVSIAATLATRDLKDASRTLFSAATVIGGVACVTTEALLTMVPQRAGTAAGTSTSIQATSGKTLRITGAIFSSRSTGASVLSARAAIRINPSANMAATDPIVAILSCTQQAAALAEAGDTCVVTFPDGIEISGNQRLGVTQVASATTGVVYMTLIGYEY